jgi:hypothetical protein
MIADPRNPAIVSGGEAEPDAAADATGEWDAPNKAAA